MVTTTKFLLDKPAETINAYVDLGFSNLFVRPVNPLGRGENILFDFEYEPEAFVNFEGKLIDVLIKKWQEGIYVTKGHSDIILKNYFFTRMGVWFCVFHVVLLWGKEHIVQMKKSIHVMKAEYSRNKIFVSAQ